jgi:hypothetical protein
MLFGAGETNWISPDSISNASIVAVLAGSITYYLGKSPARSGKDNYCSCWQGMFPVPGMMLSIGWLRVWKGKEKYVLAVIYTSYCAWCLSSNEVVGGGHARLVGKRIGDWIGQGNSGE